MNDDQTFDSEGMQFIWSASSVGAYERCPRYYQYSYIMGWQLREKSVHLIFGGHYATALESYFKYTFAGASPDKALERVIRETLITTWEHEYNENGDPIIGSGQPWDSFHNTKTRETLIRSIIWYFDHFVEDTCTTIKLSDNTPAVELAFSIPFGDEIIYRGSIDRLVDFGGQKYVMDQKTSGNAISTRFFESFTPDIQMSGYAYAGKIIFDIPISGVIIDAAQIAVGFTRFERGFIHRAQYHLDDWYDNTMATIEDARKATRLNDFRMNRQSCGNYGGCQYRRICSRAPQHRDNLFEADFTRVLRGRKTEEII